MRFFWLALSIVFPLGLVNIIDQHNQTEIAFFVSSAVGCLAEIVFIALCVSAFVSDHKRQEYVTHQKIRHDRDEDIKKWRKEFMRDSLDLYEMQDESLKRAEDLAGRSETRTASADNPATANAHSEQNS